MYIGGFLMKSRLVGAMPSSDGERCQSSDAGLKAQSRIWKASA